MSRQLYGNIGLVIGAFKESAVLRGADLDTDSTLPHAFIEVKGGIITDYGAEKAEHKKDPDYIDLHGATVLPGWCDSHTHIVFADHRADEMVLRIKGASYEAIAAAGGGILNSARRLQQTDEDALYDQAAERVHEVIDMGTLALEIKSGYGLTTDSELKILRVIKRLKNEFPIPIKATFLGAHAFPAEYKDNKESYVDLIIEDMLPQIAEQDLAQFIDVFCDRGFFTVDQMIRIVEAGRRFGLRPKVHGNELDDIGVIPAAIKGHYLSVDHPECMTEESINALAASEVIGTMLPGTSFFLGLEYAKARALIDQGAAIALATDYNPGSTPSGRMAGVLSLACLKMKMTPLEAIHAATINGAYAMNEGDMMGSVTVGKRALLQILKAGTTPAVIPYFYGSDLVEGQIIDGILYKGSNTLR